MLNYNECLKILKKHGIEFIDEKSKTELLWNLLTDDQFNHTRIDKFIYHGKKFFKVKYYYSEIDVYSHIQMNVKEFSSLSLELSLLNLIIWLKSEKK